MSLEYMEEALEVCLQLVTRYTYETNQRFLRYVKSLARSGKKTCENFARSSETYDPYWFTAKIKADVRLLRVACANAAFVAEIRRIMREDLGPEETEGQIQAALRGRGISCSDTDTLQSENQEISLNEARDMRHVDGHRQHMADLLAQLLRT